MELHFDELLGQITDFIKNEAKTETVVGQPFDLGEYKCVPVIKVGMGFGSGGGEGTETKARKGQGMGAGAGVGIEPIGFLVTKGEDISFIPSGKTSALASLFDKVPDMLETFAKTKAKEEEVV